MNKLLLSVLCLLALVTAVPCLADTANGVLVENRVVNLPNDSAKWYVSVVGNINDARYKETEGWFSTNVSLKKLRDQVHFCPVTTGTPIYQDRYASNVKGLPTVRVQQPDGTVIYEAAGKNLPMTAEGLYGAIASAVSTAQGVRPVLPWRRDMERRCPGPGPCPTPGPKPQPDPEPQPLDDGGPPDLDSQPVTEGWPFWSLALLVNGGFLVGLAAGYGRKLAAKLRSVP